MTKKIQPNASSDEKDATKSSGSGGLTLTITPVTGAALLVLLAAILFSWGQYKDSTICEIIKGNYEDKTEWFSATDHKNQEEYLKYEPGNIVYRNIYMEDFEKEFGVKPIYFPVCIFFFISIFGEDL